MANLYRWNFGDATNPTAGSNDANATYTYPQAGTVTVTLIPTIGCLDTLKVPVSIRNGAALSVDAGKDTTSCGTTAIGFKSHKHRNPI
ncbi:MAG: hypothetical protein HC817_04765 [Saprospiraceae bacterium]|nr:hypothetical protein [Saprospiraceae bacterium]